MYSWKIVYVLYTVHKHYPLVLSDKVFNGIILYQYTGILLHGIGNIY